MVMAMHCVHAPRVDLSAVVLEVTLRACPTMDRSWLRTIYPYSLGRVQESTMSRSIEIPRAKRVIPPSNPQDEKE